MPSRSTFAGNCKARRAHGAAPGSPRIVGVMRFSPTRISGRNSTASISLRDAVEALLMHYVMTCEGPYPTRAIGKTPRLLSPSWMIGRKLTIEVPEPLIYDLDPHLHPDTKTAGNVKAMYDGD